MNGVEGHRIVFVRGRGTMVYDESGKEYFDAPASLWLTNVGHGRVEIAEAMREQAGRLEYYSSFGRFTTDVTLALAERVARLSPLGSTKVLFTSGGSDGIDLAAKLARRYWDAVGRGEKTVVVTRDLAYHGLHAFGTSMTGIAANQEGIGRLVPDVARVPLHDIDALEALFVREAGRIAAFFTEPVLGTGGVHLPEADYMRRVNELCRRHDVLLVADEVITGFGRLGQWFGSSRVGLEPDIIVTAKGISSGYAPLGAVLVGSRVADPFFGPQALTFRHGMTYAGHSVSAAAGLANLDILESERLVERVRDLEAPLFNELARLECHDTVREVRGGLGLMVGIEMVDAEAAQQVSEVCLGEGFIVRVITGGTLQVSPPFTTPVEEIFALGAVLDTTIGSLRR
ncbi:MULTISPECIES: aspartate aminotransferase family protein [unclassified Nocardioides]|uniref:aminotransferase family protein n=1 Tax=unclassified Nocardioides TaxID=2615069 RepID=UPI000703A628|nr:MULTISPECIES: aminotransferase class III-fold pyridoxal phosphate-dependent enzyme [unclassified Nocardioides]KRC48901.1 hypothetical protein ASE19_18490 [Nocardioides sp. Root79]KRC75300.1 hypothetical protein ASE20_20390 [Nocardioides sp. Root240]